MDTIPFDGGRCYHSVRAGAARFAMHPLLKQQPFTNYRYAELRAREVAAPVDLKLDARGIGCLNWL